MTVSNYRSELYIALHYSIDSHMVMQRGLMVWNVSMTRNCRKRAPPKRRSTDSQFTHILVCFLLTEILWVAQLPARQDYATSCTRYD
jgi:hypothetical protein